VDEIFTDYQATAKSTKITSHKKVTTDLKNVCVCDMGIAKMRAASETTVTTITPHKKGTIPSEMYGKEHRGTAVHVYGFGCLMIELFGQRRVWGGLSRTQIMQKVCRSFCSTRGTGSQLHSPALPKHMQVML